ncbi:hypothetical protein [Streptomyces shenzhenensis]|uniref:hypothetical protein n=1 Tax=Streptomyces shenzhenensis TaxID=943815 RepID=UPI0036B8038F
MATKKNADIARQREDEVMLLRTRERLEFREIAERIGANVKNTYEAWKRGRTRLHQDDGRRHLRALGVRGRGEAVRRAHPGRRGTPSGRR